MLQPGSCCSPTACCAGIAAPLLRQATLLGTRACPSELGAGLLLQHEGVAACSRSAEVLTGQGWAVALPLLLQRSDGLDCTTGPAALRACAEELLLLLLLHGEAVRALEASGSLLLQLQDTGLCWHPSSC